MFYSARMSFFMAFIAVFALFQAFSFGAPHRGDLFQLRQPDGTSVQVRVWGDEYYQRVETLDGYSLIRDPGSGWICYADINKSGSAFLSTGRVYSDKAKLQAEALVSTVTGEALTKGLVLCKN